MADIKSIVSFIKHLNHKINCFQATFTNQSITKIFLCVRLCVLVDFTLYLEIELLFQGIE